MNEALLSSDQINLVTSYMNYLLLSTFLCLIFDLTVFKALPLSRFEMATASAIAAAVSYTFISTFLFDSLVIEMTIAGAVTLLTSLAATLILRRLTTLLF